MRVNQHTVALYTLFLFMKKIILFRILSLSLQLSAPQKD